MKITWNWGTGITLTYMAFVALIMFMVVKSFQQKIDLVTPDYYSQEIAFQTKIDASEAYQQLNEKPSFIWSGSTLIITFPKQLSENMIGKVSLYCPSNNQLDQNFKLNLNEKNSQKIDFGQLASNKYELQLSFKSNDKDYYFSESIFL